MSDLKKSFQIDIDVLKLPIFKVNDEPNMTIPPIMINRTQRNNVKIIATEGFLLALEMGLGESKTSY